MRAYLVWIFGRNELDQIFVEDQETFYDLPTAQEWASNFSEFDIEVIEDNVQVEMYRFTLENGWEYYNYQEA
jgi:hypothetical protein